MGIQRKVIFLEIGREKCLVESERKLHNFMEMCNGDLDKSGQTSNSSDHFIF